MKVIFKHSKTFRKDEYQIEYEGEMYLYIEEYEDEHSTKDLYLLNKTGDIVCSVYGEIFDKIKQELAYQ